MKILEYNIQKTLIEWININPKTKSYKNYFIHIPNEGKRTPKTGFFLKSLGLKKGVSDLFIAVPKKGFSGAWIELKTKGGRLSKEQKDFLSDMDKQGYFTKVCWSFEEASKTILYYLL